MTALSNTLKSKTDFTITMKNPYTVFLVIKKSNPMKCDRGHVLHTYQIIKKECF